MLSDFLNLPLTNPVLVFSVILFVILLAPIVLHRLRIPELIGLILAGAFLGPNGLYIMARDSSIELFGTVGLLYIMFIAGLEIDMADLRRNSWKTVVFGFYTFMVPMVLGVVTSVWFLGFSWATSVLLASMYASHTLITYPIVSKYGVTKNRAVSIAIGGTVITCVLSLLVLAVVVGMATGVIDSAFWLRLGVSSVLFALVVLVGFPIVARWFFKRYEDSVGQYIFVLALVFLASFLAQAAGLEAIIGAFLAGLSLNRLIPNTSALLNRIDFVGNAIFIPFFLIGVGMLVDFDAFTRGWTAVLVAVVMTVVATVAKFLAAWVTERSFRLTRDEGRLLFGLSNSQAAATLAAVLIGYEVVVGVTPDGEPVRLLNEDVLNGTIVMILFTCTLASFVTQKGAQNVALSEMAGAVGGDGDGDEERILIALSRSETVDELINLGRAVKSQRNQAQMVAVSVVKSDGSDPAGEKAGRQLLDKAVRAAAAVDLHLESVLRYDLNVVNGIRNVAKEHRITDIVIGLRTQKEVSDTFLGKLAEEVLSRCATTTLAFRAMQPMATVRRYVVVIPEGAEREVGFPFWLVCVWNIGRNMGSRMVFYGHEGVLSILRDVQAKHPIVADFREFTDWDRFGDVAGELHENDALMLVMSRPGYPSYSRHMAYVHTYLNKFFNSINCILIYPLQLDMDEDMSTFRSISMVNHLEGMDGIGKVIGQLFKKNR